MDIRQFSNENPIKEEKTIKEKFEQIKQTNEFKQVQNDYTDVIEDFIENYSNRSEEELISQMLKLIAQKKAEGTFDAEQIKNLANTIAPLLTEEQREKMHSLLRFLN